MKTRLRAFLLILAVVLPVSSPGRESVELTNDSALAQIRLTGYGWENVFSLSPVEALSLSTNPGVTINERRFGELGLKNAERLGAPFVAPLVNLRELPVEVAQGLARFRGAALWLSGLSSLSPESASELTRFHGQWGECEVDLSGLVSLDANTARALARGTFSRLDLSGLTRVDQSTIEALARFRSDELVLDGIAYLTEEQTAALAEFRGDRIALNSLKTLTTIQALTLARFGGSTLELGALQTLGDPQAKALASFSGRRLSLAGVQFISEEQARFLGEYSGAVLDLRSVSELSAAQARALCRFKGERLILDGLTQVNYSSALALANFAGFELSLDGLIWLDKEQLRILLRFSGDHLSLGGIGELGDDRIEDLLEFSGQMLWLRADVRLSSWAWERLASAETIGVVFNEASRIWQTDPAKMDLWRGGISYPVAYSVSNRELDILRTLPCRSLRLQGLCHIKVDQAELLVRSQADELRLDNLRALDESTVALLAQARGLSLSVADWSKRLRLSFRQSAYERSSR